MPYHHKTYPYHEHKKKQTESREQKQTYYSKAKHQYSCDIKPPATTEKEFIYILPKPLHH